MSFWITLPHAWKLQDVQAGLNVVVTVTSGLAIFTLTRCCWQMGAFSVVRKNTAATSALLTLNTLGEVLESLVFLKIDVLWHTKIFLQCCAVVLFTLMTLFSGPLARYSTRMTSTIIHNEVDGFLAGRHDNNMADAHVTWNITQTSLDRAEFPTDQLLDFIPDAKYAWVYRPAEWNNSWSMDCQYTESTPIAVNLTTNCTRLTAKFGRTLRYDVVPEGVFSDYNMFAHNYYYTNATYIKDTQIFLYVANFSNYEESTDTYRSINLTLAALHGHGVPRNETDETVDCPYGAGHMESASYTRVRCSMTRSNFGDEQARTRVAFPDSDGIFVPSAMSSNFFHSFKEQSVRGKLPAAVSPKQLIRFYQSFLIAKDTQMLQPVKRNMSVRVPAVQVASLFVAVFAFLGLLICLGCSIYALFLLWHHKALRDVPQSKLDWLLASITNSDYRGGMPGAHRARKRISNFETATYEGQRYDHVAMPAPQLIIYEPLKGNAR